MEEPTMYKVEIVLKGTVIKGRECKEVVDWLVDLWKKYSWWKFWQNPRLIVTYGEENKRYRMINLKDVQHVFIYPMETKMEKKA